MTAPATPPAAGIGLPPSQLGQAFPFHLAVDRGLRIAQAGPSLLRACPDGAAGGDLRELFRPAQPGLAMDFESLARAQGRAALWEHRASGLKFRGQPLLSEDGQALLFLWTPWPSDCGELDRHGLRAEDFAPHDPLPEMLDALQAQKIALQDERDLAEKLSEQRAGLLQANAELSRQFSQLWDELVNLRQIEAETFKIALIANNTDNAVVMTDAAGRIEWVNEGFTQITGYALHEVIGKTPGSILQGEKSDPAVIEYIRGQIRKGESFGADLINYAKSGREYWVQFEVQPIRDEDNAITNWMAIERDITEQKKSEMALLEAKKAAEAANRAKSAFLATMSHEIRTPMNAVLGTLALLLDSRLDEEQSLWANSAYTAAHSLLNIIDDILDFSKIEAGKLTLHSEDFDLPALVAEVVQIFRIRTAAKGLSLSFDIDPGTPRALRGDPFRLRQILVNLVGNAVKFTERGEIFMGVYCQSLAASRTTLLFKVRDSGIGIPEEAQPSLFDQFVQVDTGSARRYGGTGLGLAICKRLVKLMGGEIGLASRPGEGSEFWFTAQLQRAARPGNSLDAPLAGSKGEPEKSAAGADGSHGARILVAEDGEANRLVVTAMLSKAGYRVDVAEDGVKALEAADGGNYDLILMDVQMPGMDGYQATSAIRGLPGRCAQVPILAFTANALQEDRSACLAAGMNDFIAKPVEKDRLLGTVAHWLRKGAGGGRAAPAPPAGGLEEWPLLDEGALRSLAEQTDEWVAKESARIFFADTALRIERLSAAAVAEDCRALGFEAHSIKSAAMTLGALRLAAACRSVEELCRQGSAAAAARLLRGLELAFEETRAAFAAGGFL